MTLPPRSLLFLLLSAACSVASADIRNVNLLDGQLASPPTGGWIDIVVSNKPGRFIDADVQINGAGICGQLKLTIDGKSVYVQSHHHAHPRRILANAPVQQLQHEDAGYPIVLTRFQSPEPIHYNVLQLQYLGHPGCTPPVMVTGQMAVDLW